MTQNMYWLNGHWKVKLLMRRKLLERRGSFELCSKITPPHLKFSSISSLTLHALDFLPTFSSMEK
ncbi:hypothetical protein, partial [Marinifilum fragile]|uniref:hypothetical protein n=1 Tax=Marinifilum fragile TaxID=570161 RepID=UPI001C4421C6